MYQGKKQKFDWTFALVVGDFVAVALSFPVVLAIQTLSSPLAAHDPLPALQTCFAYGILILYLLRHRNLYSWVAFTRIVPTIARIVFTTFLGVLAFAAFRYLSGLHDSFLYMRWLALHAIVLTIQIVAIRCILRYALMDALHLVPVERIAHIGWSSRLERVLLALRKEMGDFQEMVGHFHGSLPRSTDLETKSPGPYLGRFDQIENKLVSERVSLFIVDEESVTFDELQKLGEICARCIVSLKVIPRAFDIWSTKLNLRIVAGIPLLGVFDLRYDQFHNRLAKRAVDILGSIVGLIVFGPVIGILALLIKRESPGPVFFRQKRLGMYGQPFRIIKLRSMRLDAEKQTGAQWAVKDDPRRLKIGKFMREWNLDELPQFWNIFRGQMSLVGPRPERPEFVKDFKETVLYYNLRHSCKPGLTGWAAVHGLRGDTSLEDRLEYDLYYIENWSLMLDFKIMVMTLLPPKNAY